MRQINLHEIKQAINCKILSEPTQSFKGIGTDTRQDLSGYLFIALSGENFDAHQFINKAIEQNASGILISKLPENYEFIQNQVTAILVEDTLKALQGLGTWARQQSRAKIIGITGSNGKTSTKEFTAAVLSVSHSVHFNQGSFNNHWGVPMTLLQLPKNVDVGLIEMGMNHYGELTELVKIAQPDVVVCTMVGKAHIEFFETVENIAKAKEEIYQETLEQQKNNLDNHKTMIFNLDNHWTKKMFETYSPQINFITMSSNTETADVNLKIESMSMTEMIITGKIQGVSGKAKVHVFGQQNLTNLMTAAAIGLSVGMSPENIWEGLSKCKTNWGRNQLVNLKSKAQMIFDGYNANPDSMKALIDNVPLLKSYKRRIGVFGEMKEMGPQTHQLHEELGHWVGSAGFDKVYFVGSTEIDFEKGLRASKFKNIYKGQIDFSEDMGKDLASDLAEGDVVLIKGSRGMKLERFVYPCEPLDFGEKK